MKLFKTTVSFLCIAGLFLLLFGCQSSVKVQEKTYFTYFDTVSTLYSYADDDEERFSKNCSEIEGLLKKYHRLFDIYNEYDGINNLCTVNKNAGGEAVVVERELIDFLLYAKELYSITDGEMNIMMGSVLSLWHSCRTDAINGDPHLPESEALKTAGMHISIDSLVIDEKNCTVRITDDKASIDVGALGKGYAAEKIAEYLESADADGYVIDLGGNIRAVGTKPDGSGWVTGIRSPFDPSGYSKKFTLSDTSCVTSGNYERFFELNGVKYHHIIDKDTLDPADYFASVTVICEDSSMADALSTALFCMSYEKGIDLVDKLDGVEVLWVCKDGKIYMTDGLSALEAEK